LGESGGLESNQQPKVPLIIVFNRLVLDRGTSKLARTSN